MSSVVLDARWVGRGGTGTVVSLLVRGIRDLRGAGAALPLDQVMLWGPARELTALAWPKATIADDEHDPHQWSGQRGGLHVPKGDVFASMHQIRPFAARNVLQLLHDTIPLHVAPSAPQRALKKAYFLAVAKRSRFVLVPSEHSRACVHDELHVPADRIGVLHYPVDPDLVARVRERRARRPEERPTALYLGRFARHKNIDRLVEAFARSEARRAACRLVVAGGSPDEVARVRALGESLRMRPHQDWLTVLGTQSQDEVDALYADADAVVMPSLEEGFGLPAWEGRSLGLAVAASRAGSLPEAAGPDARLFDPTSVDEIAAALDDVLLRGAGRGPVLTGPTPAAFATEYLGYAARLVGGNTGIARRGAAPR